MFLRKQKHSLVLTAPAASSAAATAGQNDKALSVWKRSWGCVCVSVCIRKGRLFFIAMVRLLLALYVLV